MTNKEWMSTLDAERFFEVMMWLVKDYGMRFNNTRLAAIAWLDEPHEAEPTQNKTSNALNALDCVEERKKGEWDMFDLISSAYYGKGMYFKQDNGTVYSRHSGEYMTVDEAIREFISLIDIDELTDTNVGKWIPVTERLPEEKTYVLIMYDTIAGKMQGVSFLYKDDDGHNCWTWLDRLGKNLFDIQPTHWMPLPQPLKEE